MHAQVWPGAHTARVRRMLGSVANRATESETDMLFLRTLPQIALLVTLASGLAALVPPSAAQAQSLHRERLGPKPYPGSVVYAESRWGHGRVSGPVRQGRNGLEVRLPRGSWMECARSCRETLRMETVDYWESHGNHAKDPGPGYFRFEWY